MVTDRLRCHPDAADFLQYSLDFLAARQAQNHLLLGLAQAIRDSAAWDESFYSFGSEQIEAAFVYAPSRGLLVSAPASRESIDAMVAACLASNRDVAGVSGPRPHSDELAGAWTFAAGRPMALSVAGLVYELGQLRRASPASGVARQASEADVPMIVEWSRQQSVENNGFFDLEYARSTASRRAAAGELWLWMDPEPVSMLRISPTGAGGFRISAVYTTPTRRNQGYASSLLSCAVERTLERPDVPCFLDTSAANEVANRVYRKLGFRQVSEVAHFRAA